MGFSHDQLLRMLASCPRLLLYPVQQPQYQAKLQYLTEVLLKPLSSLESFPQVLRGVLLRKQGAAEAIVLLCPVFVFSFSKDFVTGGLQQGHWVG